MKKTLYFFILVILSFCCRMIPDEYYQVYKVESKNAKVNDQYIMFEDENIKVNYNLWEEGGNIGFNLFNKSEKNIYVHLDESHFVINDFSYSYFKNREFTNSSKLFTSSSAGVNLGSAFLGVTKNSALSALSGISTASSQTNLSEASVTFSEEKIINIPPKTYKSIKEYNINPILFRQCDFLLFPADNEEIKTLYFNDKNTPYMFYNIISYTLGEEQRLIRLKNEFYVSEITNYPSTEMVISKKSSFCGEESYWKSKFLKDLGPNRFYIRYYYDEYLYSKF